MQTEKHPYELMVRWDQAGKLAGAHVQWRYVTRDDDGKVVAEGATDAEPIDIGGGRGFPLGDILSEVQTQALADLAAARAANQKLIQEKDAVEAERAALTEELESLKG